MPSAAAITRRLSRHFPPDQASVLAEVIEEAHTELVKTGDFNELKDIVRDLAEAQKRTEVKVEELAEAQKRTEVKVEELAEAQKRTEVKVEELAEAQKRTEVKVEELAEAQKRTEVKVKELAEAQKRTEEELAALTGVVRETNRELGGLGRSFAYALENEAYRNLPRVLEARFGIVLTEKMIRTEVGREEVNLLGRGIREGQEVWIVGETKARVELRRGRKGDLDLFGQLERKVAAIREAHGEVEVVRLILTHFATRDFRAEAERRGVLVIQSFEW
jgi:DNA repair ATPase RecN